MKPAVRAFNLLLMACGCALPPQPAADALPVLRVCSDDAPPYVIFDDAGGTPTGADVQLLQEIARTAGIELSFSPDTPFRRCLQMMAAGTTDLMMGLLYNQERNQIMHLYPYLTEARRVFYARTDAGLKINHFADLTGLTIGTMSGYKYFEAFDQAQDLFVKSEASSLDTNFKRLLAGRVDLVIAVELQGDYYLDQHPEFRRHLAKMTYANADAMPVYIGLSRQSPAAGQHARLGPVIAQLFQSGRLDAMYRQFYHQPATEAPHPDQQSGR